MCDFGIAKQSFEDEKDDIKSTIGVSDNKWFFPIPGKTTTNAIELSISEEENGPEDYEFAKVMMALIFIVGSLCSLDRVAMCGALVAMSQERALSDTVSRRPLVHSQCPFFFADVRAGHTLLGRGSGWSCSGSDL